MMLMRIVAASRPFSSVTRGILEASALHDRPYQQVLAADNATTSCRCPSLDAPKLMRASTIATQQLGSSWGTLWQHRGLAVSTSAAAPSDQPVVIHASAVARLKQLQAEHPEEPVLLRVEVEGGGCSGFQYRFALDQAAKPDDIVVDHDGARVVVDNVSLEFLRGSTIEFEESLMRSAFTVSSNPNSEASCGCGSSFTAKMK